MSGVVMNKVNPDQKLSLLLAFAVILIAGCIFGIARHVYDAVKEYNRIQESVERGEIAGEKLRTPTSLYEGVLESVNNSRE